MITIRLANGTVLTYNRAWFIEHGNNGRLTLKTERDGALVAVLQPSVGAIVEWEAPCKIKRPETATDVKLRQARKELRELKKTKGGKKKKR